MKRPTLPATFPQIRAIYAVARAARAIDEAATDALALEHYHCKPDEMSRRQASAFIDWLKGWE